MVSLHFTKLVRFAHEIGFTKLVLRNSLQPLFVALLPLFASATIRSSATTVRKLCLPLFAAKPLK